jgi:ribosomal protein L29
MEAMKFLEWLNSDKAAERCHKEEKNLLAAESDTMKKAFFHLRQQEEYIVSQPKQIIPLRKNIAMLKWMTRELFSVN